MIIDINYEGIIVTTKLLVCRLLLLSPQQWLTN